ncbi:MAG TPA: hypothetical protein VFF15_00345 [Flavobacteriaceae bacterium]|nr:hypothetical protein [Flavobacteriaceae bacterium]
MKNVKRILLLITIIAVAQKVLFSDFEFTTSDTTHDTVVVNSLD